ncbi:hypothetical protein Ddye_027367 [Dipteronia dyeriana]|uniref:F-box domain-containing protein n=1 Tax=Dipteronia dyeriana TaxID=168575 RepID=A0AAD9WRC1_9ROSI|nr:hypothetical protein Ddye_027367 [Dipteronia dyeriana]
MEGGVDDEVGGDGDRLSNLPENIVRHILSFLDSIDIVRASAVSRKWRYIWVSMPYLLKSLELCSIMFMDSLSLANFVSSCPHLENLRVHECSFTDDDIIEITAASLKDLSIILHERSMLFKGPTSREQTIQFGLKVVCPNLVSLKVVSLRSHKFSFQEMNSLQNVLMDFDRPDNNLDVPQCCHALSKMLKGVCNVNALKVSEVFLESRSFRWWTKPNFPWKMPNGTTSCLKYHLKIVELFNVADDKHELDLVRFFLENGYVLQKMRIFWAGNLRVNGKRIYGTENTDEFISEVMKFPRSSSNVALTFVEPESRISFYD